jgi:hypothetical protein
MCNRDHHHTTITHHQAINGLSTSSQTRDQDLLPQVNPEAVEMEMVAEVNIMIWAVVVEVDPHTNLLFQAEVDTLISIKHRKENLTGSETQIRLIDMLYRVAYIVIFKIVIC